MLGIPHHQKGSCGLRPHMVLLKFCGSVHVVTKQCEPDQHGGMQAQTLAFFWWNWGETFTPPVDPLSWLRCLSTAKATLLSHCAEARSALCSSGGLSHPVLFPELRGRFSLAQLLQAFCYRALWSVSVLEQSLRLIWEVAGQSQLVFMISSHTRYSLER